MSEKPAPQQDKATGRFLPGNNGGPGRPKGARANLTEQFLADVLAAWEANGNTAITDMIADKPGDFVKMVASLMPKEATLNINDHSDLTDDQLARQLASVVAQLARAGVDFGAGIGPQEAPEQAGGVSTLQ